MPVTYTFFGRVHPERAYVTISPPLSFDIAQPDSGISGQLTISVELSQVLATFICQSAVDDVLTLRNYVLDAVRVELDILGFIKGVGYDVELIQLTDSLGGRHDVFGIGIPILEDTPRRVSFEEILGAFTDARGEFLRRCLADLREAIREPRDTGLFLYRGIESLLQCFRSLVPNGDKSAAWLILRFELDVDESVTRILEHAAKAPRHGESRHTSSEERAQLFRSAWQIVEKYVAYARDGYTHRSRG